MSVSPTISQKKSGTSPLLPLINLAGCQNVQFLIFMNVKSVKRMTWRQQSEGLDALCTLKRSHVGTSGRIAHFIVAISFNKGLVLCEQYF